MHVLRVGALILLASCVACAGPSSVPASVAPGAQAPSLSRMPVEPDASKPLILYPKLLKFTTRNVPPEKAYVEHFTGGQWTETCDQKGVAHVLQEGRRLLHTYAFVVTPLAAGHCEVLFNKGQQHRVLRVSVAL